MSKVVSHIEKVKRIHICSNCSKEFEWNEFCSWYGTIEEVKYKACSDKCHKELDKNSCQAGQKINSEK